MQARIDFVANDISILKGIVMSSQLPPGGHLWLKLHAGVPAVIRKSQIINAFACSPTESNDMEEDEGAEETELSPKKNMVLRKNDILKIRQLLGQNKTSSMKHLMSNEKIRFTEQEIHDAIAACGRNRKDGDHLSESICLRNLDTRSSRIFTIRLAEAVHTLLFCSPIRCTDFAMADSLRIPHAISWWRRSSRPG